MDSLSIIHGYEHKVISDDLKKHKEWLLENTNSQNEKTLGLHGKKDGFAPSNFIGMVWIGEKGSQQILRVDSKFPTMDYIAMFAECSAHPIIGERLAKCFHVWTDQDFIPVKHAEDFSILIAVAYLQSLNQLCRHLRRHFVREQQNFIGKVKGKVLINKNFQQNTSRGRFDRIFCEYQSISDDILENRILLAALERAALCVANYNGIAKNKPTLQQWVRACRASLQGVSLTKIKRTDFSAARKRGVFASYQSQLSLAKSVLFTLGLNPHSEIKDKTKTLPFALKSSDLFEHYAQILLLRNHPSLIACYDKNIPGKDKDFTINVRPDFYIPKTNNQTPYIIDAKYRPFLPNKPYNTDFYQVLSYSQHRRVLKEMKCGENDDIKLAIAYPYFGKSTDSDKSQKAFIDEETDAFLSYMHIYNIPCPIKETPQNDKKKPKK